MAKRPTVYVDTNVFSFMFYDGGDSAALQKKNATREWWILESGNFEIYVSQLVLDEIEAGEWKGQLKALAIARRQRKLVIGRTALDVADKAIALRIIPPAKPADALHLATSATSAVDYFLTWNQTHLLHPESQQRWARFCIQHKLRMPLLVSPLTMPKLTLGQEVRRSDEKES